MKRKQTMEGEAENQGLEESIKYLLIGIVAKRKLETTTGQAKRIDQDFLNETKEPPGHILWAC